MGLEAFARPVIGTQLATVGATASISRFSLDRPTNRMFQPDGYWLDMCVSPRPEKVRGGYRERSGPTRYERLDEIFLMPPGESLHVRSDKGAEQRSIVCQFDPASVER